MTELTRDTFEDFISGETPVLVNFWAEGCMPCKMYLPILEELSSEMNGKVAFGRLKLNDYGEFAQRFEISSVPVVFFFRDGEPVGQLLGMHRKPDLAHALRQVFGL